jgi:hypothetical protein
VIVVRAAPVFAHWRGPSFGVMHFARGCNEKEKMRERNERCEADGEDFPEKKFSPRRRGGAEKQKLTADLRGSTRIKPKPTTETRRKDRVIARDRVIW